MEVATLIRRLENKTLSKHKLGRYFGTKSLEDLLLNLRKLRRDGYFNFEVMLSSEYFDREQAHRDVLLRTDVLEHYDPFSTMQRDTYCQAPNILNTLLR